MAMDVYTYMVQANLVIIFCITNVSGFYFSWPETTLVEREILIREQGQ